MTRLLLVFCLLCLPAQAATYYVTKAGSDGAAGSVGAPWLTIAKAAATMVAGDTVIIGNGDYDEHVYETTSGSSGSPITFQALNEGLASIRAFRIGGAYVTLDGLTIDKFSSVGVSWQAAVRIESTADNAIIQNCTIKDLPHVIANDFSFDSGAQRITSLSSDFVTAGFKVGSKVYLGASGMTAPSGPLYYVNHDQTWTVATVAATNITVTAGSAAFAADTGTNYWAFIRAGDANAGFNAIRSIVSGGASADNVQILNNTITNWPGHAIDISGTGYLLEGNTVSNLKSFRFLSFNGSDHIIRRNVIKDCPNIIHYTQPEIEALEHPAGTGWYDYQVGMLSGFTGAAATTPYTNVLIEENWFENIENQIGRVDDEKVDTYGIIYRRNVFIGVSEHFSGGRDGMEWEDNTFYKCSFGIAGHPLSIGGRPPAQTGYIISGNLFVACGKTGLVETATRGWYSISDNATTPTADGNFVASEELTGFAAKTGFSEATGVNGGDPVFYSVTDFDGPDNLPFTDDDGLKVLPTSPAAALGGGALGVRAVVTGQPVAHFRVSNPTGWFENPSDTYDLDWLAELPMDRGSLQRPYTTPVRVGEAPVAVTFDASKSLSGVAGATTTTAINQYTWAWGDGTANTVTTIPSATHTFATSGDHTVTLTVRNTLSATHSFSNTYRVTGAPVVPSDTLDVPSEYTTVQAAVNAASAGSTIRLAAGTYPETVTLNANGVVGNPIILDGQGVATIRRLVLKGDHWNVRNLTITGTTQQYSHQVYFDGGDFNTLSDCVVDNGYALAVYGIGWKFGLDGGSDNIIEDTIIQRGRGYPMISMDGSRNTIRRCTVRDGYLVDFIRLFGYKNKIQDSLFENNLEPTLEYPARGNHPDFIQTFGSNAEKAYDIVVERNIIKNVIGGLCQLETSGQTDVRDWIFRNNIFIGCTNAGSVSVPGIKWYNNTFYKCATGSSNTVLTIGKRAYRKGENLHTSHPMYEATSTPLTDGTAIIEGEWYRVIDSPTGEGVTYNGTLYKKSGTLDLAAFKGVSGVTTWTRSSSAVTLYRVVMMFANGGEVKNNVFFDCGNPTNNTNGWYTFDPLCTSISADYNYVAKAGFAPVRADTLLREIGGDVVWDSQRWYEPNGINGTDPGFNDFSTYDFRPLETSILVDAGLNITGVSQDNAGTVRPLGVRTDIGALEYDDGNPPPPPDPDPEPDPVPPAPSSLTTLSTTSTTALLSWIDNSTTETSFLIERSLDGVTYANPFSVGQNVTTATITALSPVTTYRFRVRATGPTGFSAWSNVTVSTTLAVPPPAPEDPPAAPTGLTATSYGAAAILLAWTDASDDEEYFELARSLDGVSWVTTNQIVPNTEAFAVTGLDAETTYYFRLRAVRDDTFSPWGDVDVSTTAADTPLTRRQPRQNQAAVIPP